MTEANSTIIPPKGLPLNWSGVEVTPGSVRTDRLPAPLGKDHLLIRPNGIAESFCLAGKRLGASQIVRAHQRNVGPWVRLFHAEPAYLLSQIISFNVDDAAFEFDHALDLAPADAVQMITDLSAMLENWISRIRDTVPDQFSKQLKQLNAEAQLEQKLATYTQHPAQSVAKSILVQSKLAKVTQKQGVVHQARAFHAALRATHTLVRNSIASLRQQAQIAFDDRIKSKKIDPALGLLIAELRTSLHVEARINEFLHTHTRFYYDDIIGQKPDKTGNETVLLDIETGPLPMFLPQGTKLEARLPDNTVQTFQTDAAVHLNPAQVTDIATVSYHADPDISLNAAFDSITDVRATRMNPATQTPQDGKSGTRVFSFGDEIPAQMGLDISSTMLDLAEGERWIEMSLNMKRASNLAICSELIDESDEPLNRPDQELLFELHSDPDLVLAFEIGSLDASAKIIAEKVAKIAARRRMTQSMSLVYEVLLDIMPKSEKPHSAQALRLVLARIVTQSLIEAVPFMTGVHWALLFKHIDGNRAALTSLDRNPDSESDNTESIDSSVLRAFAKRPGEPVRNSPEDLFQKLLGDSLDVTISTAAGMIRPSTMMMLSNQDGTKSGLKLTIGIDKDMPPIEAMEPGGAPTVSLRLADHSLICPTSFFERYALESVDFVVTAKDLKKIAAFSDIGLVATDQNFMPFGVTPKDAAVFVAGCAEMALKPVIQIGISLTWSDIPGAAGGFETHYEAYGKDTETPKPAIQIDYLSGDGWKMVSPEPVAMLNTDDITQKLLPKWRYVGSVHGHPVAARGPVSVQEYKSRQTIRAGLVRMTLSGSAGGFHASQYPKALVDAMRPRLLSFKERKLPPAPFVPTISSFEMSYRARDSIELQAPDSALPGERIVQVGPFGKVEVFPKRMLRDIRLFPERLGFAELYIQLKGPNVTGPMALTFEMDQSGHLRIIPVPNPIKWFYLSEIGWQELPETAISSDTTSGLMRSGLVLIDLPDDATRHSSEMSEGGVWIAAAATTRHLDQFPVLNRVTVNGVWVKRTDSTYREEHTSRVMTFDPPQPSIEIISEIVTPAATKPPESTLAYVARVSERLRHRNRAVTPWDIERLVIEAFPEIWMAKCLPHLRADTADPQPGTATLVVVRRPSDAGTIRNPAPSFFDVSTLARFKKFASALGSEFATFEVVNPDFERLQVRATLEFKADREDGAMAQKLQRDLAKYLSIWTANPALRRFGWSLNIRALHGHVRSLNYVENIKNFSVLQLVSDDTHSFQLLDTATDLKDTRGPYGPILRPTKPWSLPLSAAAHVLNLLPGISDQDAAQVTQSGVGRLTVGEMLIVAQRTSP